jgi:SSS family solute:Na+ symporter
MVILGMAWIPFMGKISGQIFVYLQSVQGYIAPPIAAIFLAGVAWKRANARGAIASLLTGFVFGMSRLVAELTKSELDGVLFLFADINFLHFAAFLFLLCLAVLVVVSLATAPPPADKVHDLTFATVDHKTRLPSNDAWRRRDFGVTVVLVVIVIAVWTYFTG